MAGGSPARVVASTGAMLALQASIGATNDVVDAPLDALRQRAKPIPAGLVSGAATRRVAVAAGLAGTAITAALGPRSLALAATGYGLGLAYDLRLKRTRVAWLPYALAVPLVPAFAWSAADAGLPPRPAVLLPLAVVAGAALAMANGLVDLEADRAVGSGGIAVRLGARRALVAGGLGEALVWLAALVTAAQAGPLPSSSAWGFVGAGLLGAGGVALSARRRRGVRRLGWEAQALALGLLGVAWLAAERRLGA